MDSNMNTELIISLYDKNISWISKINSDVKIIIYRKGNLTTHPKEILLENNVGRDVHTFFNHLYKNYDELSDTIFFSQDYPFDHVENYIELINGNEEYRNNYASLKFDGYKGYHWNSIGTMWNLHKSQQFFSGNVLACSSNGYPHEKNLNINEIWNVLFKSKTPNEYEFIPGGHFCVSKETVHIRSKQFYCKLVELLETHERMPWIVERLEPYIFDKRFITYEFSN
jgi:hypothetical protein